MNPRKSPRLAYLLLSFVFFSIASLVGFGFNILLALATFVATQIAFMMLWSHAKLRNRLAVPSPPAYGPSEMSREREKEASLRVEKACSIS